MFSWSHRKPRFGTIGLAVSAIVALQGLGAVASAASDPQYPVPPDPLPAPLSPGAPVGPEVSVITSCLNGGGLIDVAIANIGDEPATYEIQVRDAFYFDDVWTRTRTVDAYDEAKATFRVDANPVEPFRVTVRRDDELIRSYAIGPACGDELPSGTIGPKVTAINACRKGDGFLRVYFVNTSDSSTDWSVKLTDRRDKSKPAIKRTRYVGSQERGIIAISGRPDGDYQYTVLQGNDQRALGTISVDCDRTLR